MVGWLVDWLFCIFPIFSLGMARTSEIFNIEALVIPNKKIENDNQFQQISVTAYKWVPLVEVQEIALTEYLMTKKAEGYTLLGVEQTSHSVSLPDFKFPKKTVLLMGIFILYIYLKKQKIKKYISFSFTVDNGYFYLFILKKRTKHDFLCLGKLFSFFVYLFCNFLFLFLSLFSFFHLLIMGIFIYFCDLGYLFLFFIYLLFIYVFFPLFSLFVLFAFSLFSFIC